MNAIHVNWTKPHGAEPYEIEDFELLTTILSALKWREKNGGIKMVTDSVGKAYYEKIGIDKIWDLGIDAALDGISVDPRMFWAAGKLYALRNEAAPIAVIDTDFIVWEPILFENLSDITVIHREDLYEDVYPDINHFQMKDDYRFNANFNWSLPACNTAFYVIKNQSFIDSYTNEAIHFMKNALDVDDNLTYMVFAEQRLFSMCAAEGGFDLRAFSNLDKLFAHGENCFTHTWGMKQQMRDMPELRYDFCKRCVNRIINDFPDMAGVLKKIDCLKMYF